MEQNIADLLKDAFSEVEIDFDEHLQFEDDPQTQPQVLMAEDIDLKDVSKFWTTSDQGSLAVCELEENEESSHIKTELPKQMSYDASEMHQMLAESTMEESMQRDEEMEEEMEDMIQLSLSSAEGPEISSSEYQQPMEQMSEEEAPEEESSDEEEPENHGRSEESSQDDSDGMAKEPAMKPSVSLEYRDRDELREFTEDDQEQIEESLAEYPSDLSQSETEECVGEDPCASMDQRVCTEILSLQEEQMAPTIRDSDGKATVLDVEPEEVDDLQEPLTNDKSTEEDRWNEVDEKETSIGNDQPDYDSDISSDHSTSQDGTNLPEGHEIEQKGNSFTENLGMADHIDYISIDTKESNPEMDRDFTIPRSVLHGDACSNEASTELFPSLESVRMKSAEDKTFSGVTEYANSLIPDVFWSSETLMSENSLLLDEYDWDLTGEELLSVKENQEEDSDEDEEENGRDWEQEKTRIEAFYRFYGDQMEMEDNAGRNHKVTFQLNPKYEEESDSSSSSSEEELDIDLDTPVLPKKPEYDSESEDEPQVKPFLHEKPKLRSHDQGPVVPAVSARPQRNKCLAVLKSVLTLGLVTTVGVASYWWATDNLDWTH